MHARPVEQLHQPVDEHPPISALQSEYSLWSRDQEDNGCLAACQRLTAAKGVSAGQLALAWVLAQGDYLIPIPGTQQRNYREENVAALDVRLEAAELHALERIFSPEATAGQRYPEAVMALLDT